MKALFKGIVVVLVLLTAGLFSLESYRSIHCKKSTPVRFSKNRSVHSPFYNTSDASTPYAFPLNKAQRQAR